MSFGEDEQIISGSMASQSSQAQMDMQDASYERLMRESMAHLVTSVDDVLEDVRQTLMGKIRISVEEEGLDGVSYTKNVWQKYRRNENGKYTPIVNDVGISDIMMLLQSRLTRVYNMTNLQHKDIKRMMIEINDTLSLSILYNAQKWELDRVNFSLVLDLVDHTVYSFLMQSRDGTLLRFFQTTRKEYMSSQEAAIEKRRDRAKFNIFGRRDAA